jgi:hypothetical protein
MNTSKADAEGFRMNLSLSIPMRQAGALPLAPPNVLSRVFLQTR